MDLKAMADIGTFASALAAVVAIGLGVRTYKRQTNALIFLEYTKRYEEIMAAFTIRARQARLDLEGDPPKESEEITVAVLRYLNLCSEEFYLCQRGYLSKDVWSIWESELRRTVASSLVRREWRSLRKEFEEYPAFREYVDQAQADEKGTCPGKSP